MRLLRPLVALLTASAALLLLAACGTPGAPTPSRSSKIGPKPVSAKPDSLPAWTDKTAVKRALTAFVERTAERGASGFVAPADRVAVVSAGLLPASAWSNAAADTAAPSPKPLRELFAYLAENGYRVFLVTDGDPEPLRAHAREQFNLPPERVIGAYAEADYVVRDGRPAIVPRAGLNRAAKPVVIHRFVGLRPVIAVGADDADFQMLEYATLANPRPALALVLPTARATRAGLLDAAAARGWQVVSPARDWAP